MIKNLQRVLIKGGVLSPSELKQIVEMAEKMGLDGIHFGSRQDIILPGIETDPALKKFFPSINLDSNLEYTVQNIVSSYVSADIFASTPWLSGATYLYILEQFPYEPRLKINIADARQQIVPLYTGQLNFVTSEEEDYWFLYVRLPHWASLQPYPVLVHTWDIGKVAQTIEAVYEEVQDVTELFEEVNTEIDANNRTISTPLNVPFQAFPYYEGMNKMNINQYWLGLYWRNNLYNLKFLKAMCNVCLECKIGKICLTPWKSFIVKGIHKKDKLAWEKLLGSFGINVRHSSLELNWHLPLADEEALELKRFIVRNFDQNDISTYGLTFGIKSSHGEDFTSIVIEKNPVPQIVREFSIRPTYNVLYSENFDPNRRSYISYAQDIDRIELPGLLMELSQMYFKQLGENEDNSIDHTSSNTESLIDIKTYQCAECFTIYDSRYGDELQQIQPGITFEQLPNSYSCPVCAAPKDSFVKKIEKESSTAV
ncbi:MAG: rubredoxin [Bacteroidota bacterium]